LGHGGREYQIHSTGCGRDTQPPDRTAGIALNLLPPRVCGR